MLAHLTEMKRKLHFRKNKTGSWQADLPEAKTTFEDRQAAKEKSARLLLKKKKEKGKGTDKGTPTKKNKRKCPKAPAAPAAAAAAVPPARFPTRCLEMMLKRLRSCRRIWQLLKPNARSSRLRAALAEAAIVVEDEPDWKQKYEELEEIYTKETHARNHPEAALELLKKRYTQEFYAPKSTETALMQRVAHLERCSEKLHV